MFDAEKSNVPLRLASLDAYRGLAMLLMASELLNLPNLITGFPKSTIGDWISFHQSHVAWTGCSLHDLIQPSFSFMVGVALPFSLAGRRSQQQSNTALWLHALWRSLILILLGVFLRSLHAPMTNWTFEDTLSQIGLGYLFLFALARMRPQAAWVALIVILVGYWALFAAWPLVPKDFSWSTYHGKAWFEGCQAHWNQNGNPAWAFDRWFLNLFPRPTEFLGNRGGYSTLSFIPTLGTMILGLVAGRWLIEEAADSAGGALNHRFTRALTKLVLMGIACLALGWTLDRLGWCPSVKKIWTPSWVLFSGGWCYLTIAIFYLVADRYENRTILFPLTVVGLNSITMYVLVDGFGGFVKNSLLKHFGPGAFKLLGEAFQSLLLGAAALLVFWLILFWMHRRKIYLKV